MKNITLVIQHVFNHNRAKSLVWRTVAFFASIFLLGSFDIVKEWVTLHPQIAQIVVPIIALYSGELTKSLNNFWQGKELN